MKEKLSVFWARRDLRIKDNPALSAACKYATDESCPLLSLFILEDYMCAGDPKYQFGYPSRIFLSRAIPAFAENFHTFALIRGKGAQSIILLAEKYDIQVFVNEDIHPDFYTQIQKIKKAGVAIKLYADKLTVSKETVNGTGGMYSVFTPFKKTVWETFTSAKVLKNAPIKDVTYLDQAKIKNIPGIIEHTETSILSRVASTRTFLAGGVTYDIDTLVSEKSNYSDWYVRETEALKAFANFAKHTLESYKEKRDFLSEDGTSKMSLALTWGIVSARTLVEIIQKLTSDTFSHVEISTSKQGAIHYISELIWREFYSYLFYHHPKLMHEEFQEKFRGTVKWVDTKTAHERFNAWMQGKTGYPIVDAAMHQLAQTGWMHNRARMIVASVLTKNLGVDWKWGQEYFRAMLIDLDEASNNGGWQWAASVGADPKPIRIFNPYLQAENYDAEGVYQKTYLPKEYIEHPPSPIVVHKDARKDALKRYGLSEPKNGIARDY